nr:hypothetical protein [Candidatus Njordarchaeota archaeon]
MVKSHTGGSGLKNRTEKRFLVTDLDNTLIDSRERFKRSISEATGCLSSTTPPVLDVKKLLPEQRNRFYEVFLSSKYMDLDIPVRGSVEVTSRLRSMGLGIVYLTGRHHSKEDSLKSETLKTLSRLGYPMPNTRNVLIFMKPKKMMPTARFKRNTLERLTRSLEVAVGVDDEPDDLRVMADFIPLTIGLALSTHVSREIVSKIRVPIVKDWFEVESIILKNRIIKRDPNP